jgi:hypothetical protein
VTPYAKQWNAFILQTRVFSGQSRTAPIGTTATFTYWLMLCLAQPYTCMSDNRLPEYIEQMRQAGSDAQIFEDHSPIVKAALRVIAARRIDLMQIVGKWRPR